MRLCRPLNQIGFILIRKQQEQSDPIILQYMGDQKSYRKKSNIFIAAAGSSIISTIITNPIEVAKLHIQFYPAVCPQYPHGRTISMTYHSLPACTCTQLSLAGSLKSLKVAVPQVLFSNILYAELYQNIRRLIRNEFGMGSTSSTLVASLAARFVVTTSNVPLESTRIKISNNVSRKGIMPTFHGYKVTLARDMLYSSLFWSLLEAYRNSAVGGEYRDNVSKTANFNAKNFTLNLLPAFLLGGLVSAVTTPLDTLKTRVQSKSINQYSIWSSLREIYAQEGTRGLFSGVKLRVVKNSLHTSLYLFMFEWYLSRVSGQSALRTAEENA